MEFNLSDGEVFIPTLEGNDKSDSPIKFNLKYLTIQDQLELDYAEYSREEEELITKIYTYKKYVEIFSRGVESIEGLVINGKQIKTAKEFLSIRNSPAWVKFITIEVGKRLKNAGEVDIKN